MLDLEFKLKPSKCYFTLSVGILMISIIIILCLSGKTWIKLIALLPICIYGNWIIWRFALLRSSHSIISIRRQSSGQWLLRTNTNTYVAELGGDSTLTRWISVLRFHIVSEQFSSFMPSYFKPGSCVVLQDSLEKDWYRKLLVVLRMH